MYTKCELVEVLFQSCITVLLLSMQDSTFSLTSDPLQGICGGIDWFLPLSLLLSLKKGLNVSVKVQEMKKDGFQQFLGAVFYGLFAVVASIVRLMAIVLYFAVPLGLYNLLAHYQYEANGFSWQEDSIREVLVQGDKTKDIPVFLADVTNSNQTSDAIPITKYTGLSMKTYYVIFLLGMLLHFLIMLVKDLARNKSINISNTKQKNEFSMPKGQFKMGFAEKNWFSSFLRAFTSYVIPEVSIDWDENQDGLHLEEKNVIEVSIITPKPPHFFSFDWGTVVLHKFRANPSNA